MIKTSPEDQNGRLSDNVVTKDREVTTVGIRELKTHLSDYIARAKAGEVIVVTDRGEKVAQLTPIRATTEERLWELVRTGHAEWSGSAPPRLDPVKGLKEGASASDMIIQERDESVERLLS